MSDALIIKINEVEQGAPDHILRHFTIGNKDKRGNDIFRSIDELLLLFKYDRYELLYRG